MTVSLTIRALRCVPAVHQRGRFVVVGVLYLDEQLAFRVFERVGEGYDEEISLHIEDPEGAAAVRRGLLDVGRPPEYLGPAVVDGHLRSTDRGLALEQILTVHLGDFERSPAELLTIAVRPNPWAR